MGFPVDWRECFHFAMIFCTSWPAQTDSFTPELHKPPVRVVQHAPGAALNFRQTFRQDGNSSQARSCTIIRSKCLLKQIVTCWVDRLSYTRPGRVLKTYVPLCLFGWIPLGLGGVLKMFSLTTLEYLYSKFRLNEFRPDVDQSSETLKFQDVQSKIGTNLNGFTREPLLSELEAMPSDIYRRRSQ